MHISSNAELRVEHQQVKNDIKIDVYDDAEHIGFVSYTKTPLLPFYILHSLYVYPNHRKKGYAKRFLPFVCQEIADAGATKIYIQPGPFEMSNDGIVNVEDYQKRMEYLIPFYESMGFKKVDVILSWLASFIYKVANIQEDAQHLMVKGIA